VYNKEGKLLTNQTTVIVDVTIATKFVSAAERLEHHLAKTAPGTKKTKKISLWNARRTISSSARWTSSQKALLVGDENQKRRAMHSPFVLERPTRRSSQRDHL
jgi:hypothetical protein